MTGIVQLFQQAQLAEAAYANFWNAATQTVITDANTVRDRLIALQPDGKYSFSPAQASDFVKNWQVISHQPNTENGFSVTLFKYIGNDPASGFQNGQYVYAIRGTEPEWLLNSSDLSTDVGDIVADGLALDQLVAMYNDWKRLNTAVGQGYQAAVLVPVDGVPAADGYVIDQLAPGTELNRTIIFRDSSTVFSDQRSHGSGSLLQTGELTVTGHSLGGHLAAAFTRLFPGLADAVTINGAGFATGDINGLGGDAHLNIANLFSMLNGTETFGNIDNIYGDKNPEIVTQNGPGLYQQGTHSAIFIEQDSFFGNAIGHGGGQMTDSLAVYDLFLRMDSSLASSDIDTALAKLKPLFEAASNEAALSLESVTNSLSKLLGLPAASISIEFTREQLYQTVSDIRSTIAGKDFRIIPLTAFSASDTLTKSQADTAEGLAYRYALKELNPFVVLGADYTSHNSNGELNLYDAETGEGTLTEQYLKDRAKFLSWKLNLNSKDESYGITTDYNNMWTFTDVGSGYSVTAGLGGALYQLVANKHQVTFGSDLLNDILAGGEASDYLYGQWGTDTLTGNEGADYLDGGTGADKLTGGEGADRLYGGADNDTLDGGLGNDTLVGGDGSDTYVIKSGEGTDTILDADGTGGITLDGAQIKGSAGVAADKWKQLTPDLWVDTENNIAYTRTTAGGTTQLVIHKGLGNDAVWRIAA